MKIVVRPLEALAAAKDPTKYEWYQIAGGKVKIDTPKAEIVLGEGEKFGVKITRGAYFLLDADDTSEQFRIEEKDFKRLMRKAKGFRGKVDGVQVSAGKEGKLDSPPKPAKTVTPKEKPSSGKRRSKKSVKPDMSPDEDYDMESLLGDEQDEFEPESTTETKQEVSLDEHGLPPIRKARARITKRRAWVESEPEEEQEKENSVVPSVSPKISHEKPETKQAELPKIPNVRLPRVTRPDEKTLSGRFDPDTRKLYTALQTLAHTLESKEPSLSPKSRLVFKWLHAMVTPASSVDQEFAVQFANTKKWPDSAKLIAFLDEAARFASNRSVSNALHRIRKDVEVVLTSLSKTLFVRSAWASHVRMTAHEIEHALVESGFVYQAGNLMMEMPDSEDGRYLSPVIRLNTAKTEVDVDFNILIPDGREWKSKSAKTVAFPVGKVRKADVSKAVSSIKP